MEAIDVGFWSIVPPIIAIGLALLTKDVISSLIIGILSGTLIYAVNTSTGILSYVTATVDTTVTLMAAKMGDNASIILFLALLGALVAVITMAGGSKAYGDWAFSKIKSRRSALLATSALGALIFIDDYFNCLTVGTVMRPVTDKHRISHEKLAYIIDATAAPICIIAPVSSWAASVISQMAGTGLDGMSAFVQSIPFNLYAILTIVMVVFLSVKEFDFGPLLKYEEAAKRGEPIQQDLSSAGNSDDISTLPYSEKGRVFDLLIPIIALIVFSVLSMLYVGGYFDGGMTLADGFGNTDAGPALAISSFGALIVSFLLFVPRKLLSFKTFMLGISKGISSMVGAIVILTLAWTISGVCRDLLNTGGYVSELVKSSNFPPALIPAVIFLVAAFLSFATGTSWGTFGILIPIIASICLDVAPHLTIIALAATLAGAVFGDHCSPISDTTILSSTGANCAHITHVSTQIPYALLVAGICFIGYIIAGFTTNVFLTLGVSLVLLLVSLFVLHNISLKKLQKAEAQA